MGAVERPSIFAFNRGIVDALALARTDVRRIAIAAATQQNYIPRAMGSAMLRPGFAYLGGILGNNPARMVPFIKNTVSSLDLIEFTNGFMRVWQNDAPIAFANVPTTISTLIGGVGGNWVNNSEAGASVSNRGAGGVNFVSNGYAGAILDQSVNPGLYANLEHVVYVNVGVPLTNERWIAPKGITIRIGTSNADDSYVNQTVLTPGRHALSFTPSGTFNIRLISTFFGTVVVDDLGLYNGPAAGTTTLQLISPYATANLPNLRWDQSADIIYLSCAGRSPHQIEHRGPHSWSIATYLPPDGPFDIINTTPTTIAASATSGDITLTASRPLFYANSGPEGNGSLGQLVQLQSVGQFVSASLTGANQFTGQVEIFGVGTGRYFTINIASLTGTGTTVSLQRSVGVAGNWVDYQTYTSDTGAAVIYDGLDNQIIFYRIGIDPGNYAAGTISASITFAAGSITGVALITAYTDNEHVSATVIKPLGGTTAVTTWSPAKWGDAVAGWPTACALFEGRLWFAGQNGIFGSVSDAFNSFDPTVVGDSGVIQNTIGSGPVDVINWFLPLQRLIMGAQGSEWSCRADALDNPITPTNFLLRNIGGQGTAAVPGGKIDQIGVFVNRTSMRAYILEFGFQFYDYGENDLTALCPRVLKPGVVRMAIQRQPDTRIHFVRSDGAVVVCVFDKVEQVQAFVTVVTQGTIEDVVVLPAVSGNLDEQVYYVVNRTINGASVRYLEKWAQESECFGDQLLCKLGDSHVVYQGPLTTTITGLSNLEGANVVVWADGVDVGTNDSAVPWTQNYTVHGGQITLATAAANVMVGLPYSALFTSVKLGLGLSGGDSPLNRLKRISRLGVVAANIHPKGLQHCDDGINWRDMPVIEQGFPTGTATRSTYDEVAFEFGDGGWRTDKRVWIQSQAPRPCTLMGLTPDLEIAQ